MTRGIVARWHRIRQHRLFPMGPPNRRPRHQDGDPGYGVYGLLYKNAHPVQLSAKDPDAWDEFNRLFLSHSALGSALTFRGVQGKRPSIFDLRDQCRQLSVPTLIMVGDEDAPCIETSIFLKRNIPSSGLLVFPQTGHTMNLESPPSSATPSNVHQGRRRGPVGHPGHRAGLRLPNNPGRALATIHHSWLTSSHSEAPR